MSKTLDRRVTALEQRAGTPGPCACRLRITIVYDDVAVGDDSPATSSSGPATAPAAVAPVAPAAVASPLCPHGRPWQGGDVVGVEGWDDGAAGERGAV